MNPYQIQSLPGRGGTFTAHRAVLITLCSLLLPLSSLLLAQQKRQMELEDMFRVKRVSDPQPSPDGKWVAYTVAEVDKPANKTNTDIWLIPSAGGEAKRL